MLDCALAVAGASAVFAAWPAPAQADTMHNFGRVLLLSDLAGAAALLGAVVFVAVVVRIAILLRRRAKGKNVLMTAPARGRVERTGDLLVKCVGLFLLMMVMAMILFVVLASSEDHPATGIAVAVVIAVVFIAFGVWVLLRKPSAPADHESNDNWRFPMN